MDKVWRERACKEVAQCICDSSKHPYLLGNYITKEHILTIGQCREHEKYRKILRGDYEATKEDVKRMEDGMKPVKPFVSRRDFTFWK